MTVPAVEPGVLPAWVPARVVRWLKFNAVGGMGIVVQMGVFALLFTGLGLNYLAATPIAVEAAVLHNFAWHERYTWRDRANGTRRERWGRLGRFHVGNGLISIAGNVALMRLLAGHWGLNHYLASGVAISLCSVLNFAAGEWYVFRD